MPLSRLSCTRRHTNTHHLCCISFQMAKAPSKKSAKTAKAAASTDGKKKRRSTRSETYSSYIYKVLKQVHPGA